jgi:hypothetical protein
MTGLNPPMRLRQRSREQPLAGLQSSYSRNLEMGWKLMSNFEIDCARDCWCSLFAGEQSTSIKESGCDGEQTLSDKIGMVSEEWYGSIEAHRPISFLCHAVSKICVSSCRQDKCCVSQLEIAPATRNRLASGCPPFSWDWDAYHSKGCQIH